MFGSKFINEQIKKEIDAAILLIDKDPANPVLKNTDIRCNVFPLNTTAIFQTWT